MIKRYKIGREADDVEDCFEVSYGEMAVTEIVCAAEGYSWKQWCPWPDNE